MKNEPLKKQELEHFRKLLLRLRERLVGNVKYLTDAALKQTGDVAATRAGSTLHPAEAGSDNFEQEFTLSLVENEHVLLESIEAALKSIEDGTYGICESCGGRIPKARLQALPYATMCIKCAEKNEKSQS
ncbi:MAG: TraR/DksA family transcriptional regulator [Thermogutta sp.]